jgi:serine/threonine-protein kinase
MKGNFELDPVQWARLRSLLDGALALPPGERASWIDSLGPQDGDLKARLRALLAHTDGSPLDTLPHVETAQFAARVRRDEEALAPGAAIGPYRLLRQLGEGGMGAVWLAERSDMLHKRQVALKLPRLLTGRAALRERLAREREILAALNHPNIARLYDAGVTADSQPWLALEYVEGERIDAYCARKALDVPMRLRLFVQVARAVAHAHAHLVVHRDLKPANILVTEAGEVRLLDFGIAKLLDEYEGLPRPEAT